MRNIHEIKAIRSKFYSINLLCYFILCINLSFKPASVSFNDKKKASFGLIKKKLFFIPSNHIKPP